MTIAQMAQNFADATGIIVDRTFSPPLVLGQAFFVSKSRVVTCAGCINNYTEAPWALAVNFPHPGLSMSVKSIALHPEFDRKEARINYLNQNVFTRQTYPVQFNDLATLLLTPDRKEPPPEDIVKLHKVLTIPFSREDVDVSGALKENELIEVVKKLVLANKAGLLTLYDELNIPLAYIQMAQGTIERTYFQSLLGEMAFAELIYRQTAKGFAFQSNYNLDWGDLGKINTPAIDLIEESSRRVQELLPLLDQLGGNKAVYQRVIEEFSGDAFSVEIQWLINNLWDALDGYISIDKLSERVGADTFTIAQAMRELSNSGVVSLINKTSPFHLGGKFGPPIISHTDFDINPGDSLKAFYLDPLSGAPCWKDGEFIGVASVLQSKNLLHSIPLDLRVPGALVLKNYKLIGVHNGAVQSKVAQSDRQLYQMMWIGALFDMRTKRLRSVSEEGEEESINPTSTNLSSLRVIGENEGKITVDKLAEKYTCPVCFATNTKLGNCFNCGAVIEEVPKVAKKEGFFITKFPVKAISDFQEKHNISDRNLFIGSGILGLLLVLAISSLFKPSSTNQTQTVLNSLPKEHKNSEVAVRLAVNEVGLKSKAPPGYWFEDTNALTSPLSSFGIFSDSGNQKVIFVVFNDLSPVHALDRFIQIPPFTDVTAPAADSGQKVVKVAEGSQILGEGDFHYYVHTYPVAGKGPNTILVGSFPIQNSSKSVLVLGQGLKDERYDYKSTLFLVDAMAEPLTTAANEKKKSALGLNKSETQGGIKYKSVETTAGGPNAESNISGEQNVSDNAEAGPQELIDQYCSNLQEKLSKKISQSHEVEEILNKPRKGKLKVVLDIDLGSEGHLRKIEITEPDSNQKLNDIFVKIVQSGAPYPSIPEAEGGVLSLRIVLNKAGEVKVEPR